MATVLEKHREYLETLKKQKSIYPDRIVRYADTFDSITTASERKCLLKALYEADLWGEKVK